MGESSRPTASTPLDPAPERAPTAGSSRAGFAVGPFELRDLLRTDRPPLLLDVRPREQRSIVHLPDDRWVPLSELPERVTDLPIARPIVVYCHHGGTARRAVELLRASGFPEVSLLDGGIDEYARVVDPTLPRYGDSPTDRLVLRQFPNLATGCLAYLLHDRATHDAVIVDPGLDIGPYLHALTADRLRLRAVVETHTHADHLSGHAELHGRTDAPVFVSHRSGARYPHRRLSEGEAVDLGTSELLVLETPGHTDDHLALRIPGAVFTGDTLLPGSCGRTDLGGGDPRSLWESLRTKLMPLPDETEVFPAHYGARHGLPPPERYSSTIGFERRTNEALTQPDEASFLRYMTEGWPPKPGDFDRIVRRNLEH